MVWVMGTNCRLCGSPVSEGDAIFSTWGVFFPRDHRLFPCCDAPLHQPCVAAWPDRAEFSQGQLAMWRGIHDADRGTLLGESGQWLFGCGPTSGGRPPRFVHVLLAEWPVRLYSPWGLWEGLVSEFWSQGLSGGALEAAGAAIAAVRDLAPDLQGLEALWRSRRAEPGTTADSGGLIGS